ncbi:MAG: hypothetical protein ACPGYX_11920, partial [Oceanobacter sp.]
MLVDFFQTVRLAGVPATVKEYLDLLTALKRSVAFADQVAFYALARLCLVKDEKYFDRFDRAFTAYFEGIQAFSLDFEELNLPLDWLKKELDRVMTQAEKDKIEGLGSLDQILEAFKERLE